MKNPYSCESLLNMGVIGTIVHGSIGGMTMGIYPMFLTVRMINCINGKIGGDAQKAN